VDDFQFVLRQDRKKLGRVQELLDTEREITKRRKLFDVDEGKVKKDAVEAGSAKDKGRKKGKSKRARIEVGEDDIDVDAVGAAAADGDDASSIQGGKSDTNA